MAIIEERIAALEIKLKRERAKKQQIEARKRAIEAKKKRNNDTRKKILVGAMFLERMERDESVMDSITRQLSSYLTRDADLAVFGLPPMSKAVPEEKPNPAGQPGQATPRRIPMSKLMEKLNEEPTSKP